MILSMNDKVFKTLIISLVMMFSQSALSAVVTTSASVGTFTGSGGGDRVPLTGLDQFDSSLGTLTGIVFRLDISNYEAEIALDSYEEPVDEFGDPTGAVFSFADLGSQISLSVDTPGGGGLLFATTGIGGPIFDEFDVITVGPASSSVSDDVTTRLQTNSLFNDFIGNGQIDFMELGIFAFFEGAQVTFDDGSTAPGTPSLNSFSVGPSTVSIDYTYVSAVPVPAAVWLFGSGLLSLVGFARRRKI
jgi:hypothetical protein